MATEPVPDYSDVVSATGFLRPRASRSMATFHEHLLTSTRILALLGAGLSASSGIPTYRGAGGLWRTHDATQLSTPAAFAADPALVWEFHLERLKEIQKANPNAAHHALAEFAKKNVHSLALTMNVDNLSERAGHPEEALWHLHGLLGNLKCSSCDLLLSPADSAATLEPLLQRDSANSLTLDDVPRCRREECKDGLLRPAVVWFTESLPQPLLASIATWIGDVNDTSKNIDAMLVIGTSALVYPATAYIEAARRKGARVAVVDIEKEDPSLLGLAEQDWYLQGDAAVLVPEMLKPIIGS
ncbi:SIR2 family histone deacetylase [Periconia macrospinosa]|uniref:SIR2 family histone deacetylase n=1 Tax=Periconia macrospinosa TaxID=97972 RepID=A0A2V1E250_9PLEO|nr:SIR2 family histone deacetylase [Periconia macrospinosa]